MKRVFRTAVLCMFASCGICLGSAEGRAQDANPVQAPAPTAQAASGGTIKGTVKTGPVPLPGVAITATNTLTGKKYATTTDMTGAFAMAIPRNGRYVVRAELAAFADETKEVLINAAGENGGKPEEAADFTMQLASRVQQQQEQQQNQQSAAASSLASSIGRGMQSLSVTGGGIDLADASAGTGNAGAQMPTMAGLGGDAASTDSVAVSGQMGQTNGLANMSEDDIRQRVEDAMSRARQQGGANADVANAVAGMLGGIASGGGGGRGGFGGGSGGGAFTVRGGGGRGGRGFNPTQPHGAIFYQGGNGALNATNYSLTGAPVVKPAYSSNRFGVTFAGSPFIPGLIKPSTKQFVFFNITGQRNTNPQNLYATVPTEAERAGDFSQLSTPIFDPSTTQQFQCNGVLNVICGNRISSQASSLLKYYPAPNIAAVGQQGYNYQTITAAGQNSLSANGRYVRNFGQNSGGGFRMRQQQGNGPKTLRQNINFGVSYSHSASDLPNVFLPLGGSSTSDGYNLSAGYTIGYGRLTNNATVTWNRSHASTLNFFTNGTDNPAADAGILVGNAAIASNRFYYGVPSLTFSGLTGLNSTAPSDAINQTISFSDFVSWNHKKHNFRFGGDYRRVHADSLTAPGNLQSGASPLGAFTFTGYATQNANAPSGQTGGFSFADFLLGLPQQAAVQAGLAKSYLRANVWDLYATDDWRILPNLTLNYGLRYEYFSPYAEKYNRLVNLDHNANFTEVAPVTPGQSGPFSGPFPRSLVNPDHTMFSPRFGFAYRPKGSFFKETVIRGGYGINYNTQQYSSFARQLAFQPPFAVTQTNIAQQQGCGVLALADAFNCSTAAVQNNYSVNLNYRLGHVQVWNLDIQRTLPMDIVLNIGYNGALGGNLDIVRAPNRSVANVLNPTAQPFNYEDSLGFSRFHALSINARKRMQKGISLQATYQYGHSIDNASSIGGSTAVPAQNDLNLNAEEGNSSFDIRQKLTGNWVLELPFGPNRAYFSKGGFWSKALDNFSLSGDFTFATGTYYTPHYVATVAETATGTNNSLRPDRIFSQPIHGSGTILDWFNAAAFTAPANVYGTASRGSILGPGTVAVDGSLSRTVPLGETRSFEARMTATNVFNTVQYSGIDTTLNSRTFGQVTSTANMRQLTFTARYRF
ncbi:TonB-dependent receptor [Edaphobacter modestus]|uniref:TonB-dependent receptor n=1 Tax=Edaphobacter modestus TaxID=388466 RepID=UPI001F5E5806|nr:TonB-dependent receptor [Edaphobacter modestus]